MTLKPAHFLVLAALGVLGIGIAVAPLGAQTAVPESAEAFETAKLASLERVLGPMHDFVGHAIIPFDIGGNVDMYYFPQSAGTAMATMELLRFDGDIPLKGRIGTYELVSLTKKAIEADGFEAIERRVCATFTVLGRYSAEAVLNPLETCEIPFDEGTVCLIFDEYPSKGAFNFDGKRRGLLLVIEVFEDEMNFARQFGTKRLIALLKASGHYPYSDLDRKSVVVGQ